MKTDGDSERVRNLGFGEDERPAREFNDAFIRPATGVGRQIPGGFFGDIATNEREVAGFQLENVRAAMDARGLRPVCVRVRAESAFNHIGT